MVFLKSRNHSWCSSHCVSMWCSCGSENAKSKFKLKVFFLWMLFDIIFVYAAKVFRRLEMCNNSLSSALFV